MKAAAAAKCKLRTRRSRAARTRPRRSTTRRIRPAPATTIRFRPRTAPTARHRRTENLVHALEHGRIILQYDPTKAPQRRLGQLKGLFDEDPYHLVLTPNATKMPYAVAATAWGHIAGCKRVTDETFDVLRAFTRALPATRAQSSSRSAEAPRNRARPARVRMIEWVRRGSIVRWCARQCWDRLPRLRGARLALAGRPGAVVAAVCARGRSTSSCATAADRSNGGRDGSEQQAGAQPSRACSALDACSTRRSASTSSACAGTARARRSSTCACGARADAGAAGHRSASTPTTAPTSAARTARAQGQRGSMVVSDPIWAGEADQVQYRIATSGSPRDVRLHFVNTKGTATRLDRLRSGLRRDGRAAVLGKVASLIGRKRRRGLDPAADRDARRSGARRPARRARTPAYGEVKLAFVHHTVTANDYGPEDSAAMVLAICRYHRNSNGWNDIGYQFLVDKYGTDLRGPGRRHRPGGRRRAGAGLQHAVDRHLEPRHLQHHRPDARPGSARSPACCRGSWRCTASRRSARSSVRSAGGSTNRYPAGQTGQFDAISGHRDGDATSCPGDGLYAQLPRLRVDGRAGPARRAPCSGSSAARQRIPYGRKARLAGSLKLRRRCPALDAREVRISALGSHEQPRTVAKLPTDAGGAFAFNLRLAFNRTLLADFRGDGAARPAASRRPRGRRSPACDGHARRDCRGARSRPASRVRRQRRGASAQAHRAAARRPQALDRRRFVASLKKPVPVRQGRVRVSYRLAQAGRLPRAPGRRLRRPQPQRPLRPDPAHGALASPPCVSASRRSSPR